MFDRILADLVAIAHLAFILFAAFGGLWVLRRRWLALAHVPAFVYGALLELGGGTCPLTPLENSLRRAAGQAAYSGGFVEHYIYPLIYPPGLTRDHQLALGVGLLVLNAVVYAMAYRRQRRMRLRVDL